MGRTEENQNSATVIEADYLDGGLGVMKVWHKNSFLTKIDLSKVLKEFSLTEAE